MGLIIQLRGVVAVRIVERPFRVITIASRMVVALRSWRAKADSVRLGNGKHFDGSSLFEQCGQDFSILRKQTSRG